MKTKKILTVMFINLMLLLIAFPVLSQKTAMGYDELETKQDEIEDLYVKIYDIIDMYPKVTYDYVYEDGMVTEVKITGIENINDKKQLEVLLIDLNDLKAELMNYPTRIGVFYAAEQEPEPKNGYRDFYQTLYSHIEYPESATSNNVEGTVFVKFVVDHEGNVESVHATEDIDATEDWAVKDMVEEAKRAVKATSGDWIPAKIGTRPVAQWVVLPVQYKIESRPFSRSPF